METNVIYNEDCLKGIPDKIEDSSIDMILADLPYGTTDCDWDSIIPLDELWQEYKRVIKDGGSIVLTANFKFANELYESNKEWFKYELIWSKNCCKNPGIAKYRPLPSHEYVLIFCDGKTTYNPQMREGEPYVDIRNKPTKIKNDNEHKYGFAGSRVHVVNEGYRYPLSIIEVTAYNKEGQHPTQKPVELFEYLVKTYTNKEEIVLDNVIGSGTTALACLKTNRKFIGFEQEEKYYNMALKRIGKFDKKYYEDIPGL